VSTIHGCFGAQARATPDAVAAEQDGVRLTYAELDERANHLAHRLIRLGVQPGDRVAVLQQHSLELIVSLLGILKAGAAYLPLHVGYPPARQGLVTADASAAVLLVDRASLPVAFDHQAEVVVVGNELELTGQRVADPGVAADGTSLAYVIYTSGSTGVPKGVAVEHHSVVDLATDECWRDGAHAAVLLHAPYAFDISSYELWVPLLNGGRVVVAAPGPLDGRRLRQELVDREVTAVHLTAGLFSVIADELPGAFSSVREVLTGGDLVSPSAVSRVLAACPGTRIRHLYGPTEVTLFVTHQVIEGGWDSSRPLPLGEARSGMRAYLLDQDLVPVREGEAGELFAAGSGVARGYLGRPDLTQERFLPDPWGEAQARMYRTGDLARRGPDGLEFLGRQDGQLKIRGYRVEVGEVEIAVGRQPGVSRAAVTAPKDRHGQPQLAAYVVAEPGSELTAAGLRSGVAETLPDYMVPAVVTILDTLPLTPNGKVDRAALPPPEGPRRVRRPHKERP
jgi:amino acid adenylation domain-containing protein